MREAARGLAAERSFVGRLRAARRDTRISILGRSSAMLHWKLISRAFAWESPRPSPYGRWSSLPWIPKLAAGE